MIILPINQIIRIFKKWRPALIILCVTFIGLILLYLFYPVFHDFVNRNLPKHFTERIMDYTIPILIGTIFTLFLSGRKKKQQVLNENSRRLGITFQKTDDVYLGEYKGRKITYSFSGGKEKHDRAKLVFYHQRPLNLGLYLDDDPSTQHGWLQNLRMFVSQGYAVKQIELPIQLQEEGIKCWATEIMIGKQLLLNQRIINPILHLSEFVKQHKGWFSIDDLRITMQFPFDTLLNNTIAESAYQVSSAFSNSIMLPQQLSRSVAIWKIAYKAVWIVIPAGLFVFWVWSTINKLK